MKNQEKMTKIIEWLYVNDGMFKSKNEWREKFVGMLKSLFSEEGSYNMGIGQIGLQPICTCSQTNGYSCPVHGIRSTINDSTNKQL
jgi:hypothetical protein